LLSPHIHHPSAPHRDLHSFPTRRSSDLGTLIWIRAEAGNSVKRLAVFVYMYPLCFYALVRLPGTQIFILFGAAAGPVYHHAIDLDRKSTRLNSSHRTISYAVFCLKKKK